MPRLNVHRIAGTPDLQLRAGLTAAEAKRALRIGRIECGSSAARRQKFWASEALAPPPPPAPAPALLPPVSLPAPAPQVFRWSPEQHIEAAERLEASADEVEGMVHCMLTRLTPAPFARETGLIADMAREHREIADEIAKEIKAGRGVVRRRGG